MEIAVYIVGAIALVTIVLMSFYCYYSWRLGVPTVSSSGWVVDKLVGKIPPDAKRIVEMGSGLGVLAFAAARARPDAAVVGIEYSILPLLYSKMKLFLTPSVKNLKFVRQDFFAYDLHDTQVIFCYLLEPMLEKLRPKFLAEMSDDAVIICNHYRMARWQPAEEEMLDGVFEKAIRVYKKGGAEK